jgi:cobalt-zinc-cadmium efflux system outer membrane protein
VAGYIGDEIGELGRAGQQGAFVRQEIVTAGKLRLNQAVAGHEVEQARWEMEIQRRRVINDVRIVAYDVVASQELVRINEELVRIGEAGLRAAEVLQRAKEVAKVDVLQARVEANSARLQLDNARNAHLASWRKLAVVVGTPDLPPAPIDESLADAPNELAWEASLSKLLSESPELAKAHTEVERARCAWARESAGRIPNIDIGGGVRYNNASGYSLGMLQIGVPIPLFNRNQGNMYRAQSELAAAQSEVRRVELALQSRLAEAFKTYGNARQQVQRYGRDILPDAKETLDLTRKGYQQGEFGYLQLLTAQRSYSQANRGHVEGLRDLWTSTTHIEGLLLTGGLESPGRP